MSSQKGEKYFHKGSRNGEVTLLSIIPYKAETLKEGYDLSIMKNGEWYHKLLQTKEKADSKQKNFFMLSLLLFLSG
jgi:hypothetical protein